MIDPLNHVAYVLFAYNNPDEAPVLKMFGELPLFGDLRGAYPVGAALYKSVVTEGAGAYPTLVGIV